MSEIAQYGFQIWDISGLQLLFLRIGLFILGMVVAIHLICTANFLKPGTTPWHLTCLIAAGVGSAVGVMHGAVIGDVDSSLLSSAACCAALILFSIDCWLMGLRVCEHFEKRSAA